VSAVNVADRVRIPAEVNDLESFRAWARSAEFPEHGWVSYLAGEIWVDVSMEQPFTHNQVKTQFTVVLGGLVGSEGLGYYFSDRALLTNPDADLSTEPDGTFASYRAVQAGKVRLEEGVEEGHVELSGSPEMTLEVVSSWSVRKDRKVLRDLYWRAGVSEYWLVDARGAAPRFDILRRTTHGYAAARARDGWVKSKLFGRPFRLVQEADPLGHPRYRLLAGPAPRR
jgi:Uma2 family endonuclease